MEQTKYKGHTPTPNHPWRSSVKPDVAKWAYEQSTISKTNNVISARPETLKVRNPKVYVNKAR